MIFLWGDGPNILVGSTINIQFLLIIKLKFHSVNISEDFRLLDCVSRANSVLIRTSFVREKPFLEQIDAKFTGKNRWPPYLQTSSLFFKILNSWILTFFRWDLKNLKRLFLLNLWSFCNQLFLWSIWWFYTKVLNFSFSTFCRMVLLFVNMGYYGCKMLKCFILYTFRLSFVFRLKFWFWQKLLWFYIVDNSKIKYYNYRENSLTVERNQLKLN